MKRTVSDAFDESSVAQGEHNKRARNHSPRQVLQSHRNIPMVISLTGTSSSTLENVDIFVGPNNVHFNINREMLCDRVPYFDNMFNPRHRRSLKNHATFPNLEPEMFRVFLRWVQTGRVEPAGGVERFFNSDRPNHLYALADKLCAPDLMDTIISMKLGTMRAGDKMDSWNDMKWIYKNLPRGSPMRKLVAYEIGYIIHTERDPLALKLFEIDDLVMMMVSHPSILEGYLTLCRNRPQGKPFPDPSQLRKCLFHHHVFGRRCSVRTRF
ncbi:hypothetical protein PVAG01_09514 [Phlyctema vagabunda]|uniref:BTB domain-containing protein n=1 Tax=Phlyctema vagabunda TaxID=108571 RepID=A0ABR4P7R2_9HELO